MANNLRARTSAAVLLAFGLSAQVFGCGVEECPPTTYEVDGKCWPEETSSESAQTERSIEGSRCESDAECSIDTVATIGTCDIPEECEGSRPRFACVSNRCTIVGRMPDDGACTTDVEIDDCGRYPSVFCNGEQDQFAKECAVSCDVDDDCDPGSICAEGDCIATESLNDGESCSDDDECESEHCQNGYCCDDDDCCRSASHCPSEYSAEGKCTDPANCQGTRVQKTCRQHTCGSEIVEDDTSCADMVVGRRCSEGDVMCTGKSEQVPPPMCAEPAGSMDTSTPPPSPSTEPMPAPAPQPTPTEPPCNPPTCCRSSSDCPRPTPRCVRPSACQGESTEYACEDRQCVVRTVADDSGCSGKVRDACEGYADLKCTASISQPESAECSATCRSDRDCDSSRICVPPSGGMCQQACSSDQDCDETPGYEVSCSATGFASASGTAIMACMGIWVGE